MNNLIVGIDLGTTNSEIAIVREGQVKVIHIENERPILPSVVGLANDGSLLVGAAARNQYVLHPERTIRSVKRRMGEATHLTLGDTQYSPAEISALILGRLKKVAETTLGTPVGKAVITVPAYFSDAQRQATREAGELAGLEVVRILNEPTAAALAYGAQRGAAGRAATRKSLVYDLGGGTFDVSIVNMEGDVVEVLASHGNNHLGGDDFDQKIIDFVLAHLTNVHGVDASTSATAMARLQRAAEAAKIELSEHPYATLSEEFLLEKDGAPVHLSLEIARHEYEELIAPYIAETMDAVHVALSGAKLTVSDIDEVLLVGGATRTPLVARRLEALTGIQPHGEIDPDLCVAMGAAVQASTIAGGQSPTVLIDITPYTFGTSTLGFFRGEEYPFCYVPLIRKNTPIPAARSEVFYTVMDNQHRVEVMIYQGESVDALDNIEIGRFMVEGLSKVPAGNPVVLDFSIDINGILNVRAREKKTGLEVAITIDNAISRFEEGKLDAARDRIRALLDAETLTDADDDEADSHAESTPQQRRALVEAEALIEKAERSLQKASADDREDLVDGIEALRDAIGSDNEAAIADAMGTLADILYYLES